MEFLVEDANTHLEHLEDDIILNGAKGGENALNFLDALRDMQGSSNKKVNLTVKWDGAPAIVAGIDPSNGKFFVATKSLFNKTPKINYTFNRHCKKSYRRSCKHFKRVSIIFETFKLQGILQGDLMFTQKLKKTRGITSPSGKKRTSDFISTKHDCLYSAREDWSRSKNCKSKIRNYLSHNISISHLSTS